MKAHEYLKELLIKCDPKIRLFRQSTNDEDYTVWNPQKHGGSYSDDSREEDTLRAYVARYTRQEHDETLERILQAFEDDPRISYEHMTDYESDTGYIHHDIEVNVSIDQ